MKELEKFLNWLNNKDNASKFIWNCDKNGKFYTEITNIKGNPGLTINVELFQTTKPDVEHWLDICFNNKPVSNNAVSGTDYPMVDKIYDLVAQIFAEKISDCFWSQINTLLEIE